MHTKHQVISGIIGGIVGSIITALAVSSVTAQRDKFDTIQCRRIEVVDDDNVVRVLLSTDVVDVSYGRLDPNIKARIIGTPAFGGLIELTTARGVGGVKVLSPATETSNGNTLTFIGTLSGNGHVSVRSKSGKLGDTLHAFDFPARD